MTSHISDQAALSLYVLVLWQSPRCISICIMSTKQTFGWIVRVLPLVSALRLKKLNVSHSSGTTWLQQSAASKFASLNISLHMFRCCSLNPPRRPPPPVLQLSVVFFCLTFAPVPFTTRSSTRLYTRFSDALGGDRARLWFEPCESPRARDQRSGERRQPASSLSGCNNLSAHMLRTSCFVSLHKDSSSDIFKRRCCATQNLILLCTPT